MRTCVYRWRDPINRESQVLREIKYTFVVMETNVDVIMTSLVRKILIWSSSKKVFFGTNFLQRT